MISDRVIKEIYKKYGKPAKNPEDLHLDHYVEMLSPNHHIKVNDKEVVFEDQEKFSPFRRFLLRSLNAVLEFDRQIAFVFRNHILFLSKDSNDMRVHMRPCDDRRNILQRLFA